MKKIINTLLVISFFFIFSLSVDANTLNKLDVDIKIDKDGTLFVTEIWDMNTTEDTEIYIPKNNLRDAVISNFKVRDEESEYTYNPSWDINGSFGSKIRSYGINYKTGGDLELCWGISDYGNKTYTISYTISDIIFNVSDAQVLYLSILPTMDFPPKTFDLTIEGYEAFKDTLDVWAYGYEGLAYVNSGKIQMIEERSLRKNEYITVLVKFDKNYFTTTTEYNEYSSFNDVYEAASENTFDNTKPDFWEIVAGIFNFIISISPFLIVVLVFLLSNIGSKTYKFGDAGKTINKKDLNAFRDIPCQKNIYRADFIAVSYALIKQNTDFFGCMLLKWLNEDIIKAETVEKKALLGKNKLSTNIILNKEAKFNTEIEEELHEILLDASVDGILEENELSKWSKENYGKLYKWLDKVEIYGREFYEKDMLVKKVGSQYQIDDKVKKDAIELAGLKKYLNEFSLIKEKEPLEVKLWKDYLVYAQLFGIADKVAEKFKDLYPEIVSEMVENNYDVDSYIRLNHFSRTAVASAYTARETARAAAREAASHYTSGGGGFSSGGGGGGSFGGGGHGGSR